MQIRDNIIKREKTFEHYINNIKYNNNIKRFKLTKCTIIKNIYKFIGRIYIYNTGCIYHIKNNDGARVEKKTRILKKCANIFFEFDRANIFI